MHIAVYYVLLKNVTCDLFPTAIYFMHSLSSEDMSSDSKPCNATIDKTDTSQGHTVNLKLLSLELTEPLLLPSALLAKITICKQ